MGQIVKIEASILEKIVAVAERIAQSKEERRVGREEFAHMLNIEPETLDARIREGRYQRPYKDGRKSFGYCPTCNLSLQTQKNLVK